MPLCGDTASCPGEKLMSLKRDAPAVDHTLALWLRCTQEHLLVRMLSGSPQRAVLHKILILKPFSSHCQFLMWKEREIE